METNGLPAHSDNADEELRRIHLALNAVFHNNGNLSHGGSQAEWFHQRQLADSYLTSFQSQTIAWMVCDKMLQESISSSENIIILQQRRFFAAQTLYTKCCCDIHQLPTTALPSLRDSLLVHLKQYATGTPDNDEALKTRLAMCISVLSVQMGWTTIVSDVLLSSNHYHDIAILILRALPEECASDRIILLDENTRYQMRDHLILSASTVFAYLLSTIEDNQVTSTENALKVFFIWIRYVPVPPTSLIESRLLWSSINCLTQNQYLETAADVVVEVLHMYPSHRYGNEELAKLMIPRLLELPLDDVLRSRDDDVMRVYCRLVTEMGESYLSFILSTDYILASKLVEWVLKCSEITDQEISSITFHFWYQMVMDLEDCEPMDWRQELIDYYTPHLFKLVDICVSNLMRYPQDIDDNKDDRFDDLQNHRSYVAETIEDCCRLLGGDRVLQKLGYLLKEEVNVLSSGQSRGWYGIEACFACIAAVRSFVPKDEKEFLPYCFDLIPKLPSENGLLRSIICKMIGNYAFWLSAHSELLQPLLPYLSHGLRDPSCASAAAIAIRELCGCSNQSFTLAEPVLHLYEEFTARPGLLDLQNELQVLQGLCQALSRSIQDNRDDGRAFLARIAQPIGNRLSVALSSEDSSAQNQVMAEIDRFTVVVRFLLVPLQSSNVHPILELFQSMWSMLQNATNRFPTNHILSEKICRLHKYGIRSCGSTGYAPMLEQLVTEIIRSFEKTRQSSFLYLASICVTDYAKDTSRSPLFFHMVTALSNNMFSFLHTFNELTAHPDVVEEYFYMMGRLIDHFPDQFVMSPLITTVFECAIVSVQVDHQGAQKGTLKYLDSSILFGLRRGEHDSPESQVALRNALSQVGQPLVLNLMRVVAGDLPSYSNQAPEVLFKLSLLSPSLLHQWLIETFKASTAFPVQENSKTEFVSAVGMGLARDEFHLVVTAFRTACERERRLTRMRQEKQRRP